MQARGAVRLRRLPFRAPAGAVGSGAGRTAAARGPLHVRDKLYPVDGYAPGPSVPAQPYMCYPSQAEDWPAWAWQAAPGYQVVGPPGGYPTYPAAGPGAHAGGRPTAAVGGPTAAAAGQQPETERTEVRRAGMVSSPSPVSAASTVPGTGPASGGPRTPPGRGPAVPGPGVHMPPGMVPAESPAAAKNRKKHAAKRVKSTRVVVRATEREPHSGALADYQQLYTLQRTGSGQVLISAAAKSARVPVPGNWSENWSGLTNYAGTWHPHFGQSPPDSTWPSTAAWISKATYDQGAEYAARGFVVSRPLDGIEASLLHSQQAASAELQAALSGSTQAESLACRVAARLSALRLSSNGDSPEDGRWHQPSFLVTGSSLLHGDDWVRRPGRVPCQTCKHAWRDPARNYARHGDSDHKCTCGQLATDVLSARRDLDLIARPSNAEQVAQAWQATMQVRKKPVDLNPFFRLGCHH